MHAFDEMTEPELEALFIDLSELIIARLPENTGFILLASPLHQEHSVAQFSSNVEQGDAIKWMADTIQRWQAGDVMTRD